MEAVPRPQAASGRGAPAARIAGAGALLLERRGGNGCYALPRRRPHQVRTETEHGDAPYPLSGATSP